MQGLMDEALAETGLSPDDLAMIIPHQSNLRIIESFRNRLKLPKEKVAVNIEEYGNTSAASIGLALDEARRNGKLKEGDLVLLVAFGAGITWGSLLLRL
jgi:3-oxoacyl-[acyl-carrier-protein] synthase-3